jgi:hypothetical protein
MLIVDDILLFPVHGIMWIFREISNAAQQELQGATESITTELSELYMMLETKRITEQEFDERERVLLDRLDKAQEYANRAKGEDAGDEDEEEEAEAEEDEEADEEPAADVLETESDE